MEQSQNQNERYFNPLRRDELRGIDRGAISGQELGVGPIPPPIRQPIASTQSEGGRPPTYTVYSHLLDQLAESAVNQVLPADMPQPVAQEEEKQGRPITFQQMFDRVNALRARANAQGVNIPDRVSQSVTTPSESQSGGLEQQLAQRLQERQIRRDEQIQQLPVLSSVSSESQPAVLAEANRRAGEAEPPDFPQDEQFQRLHHLFQNVQRGQLLFGPEYLEEFKMNYSNPARTAFETRRAMQSLAIDVAEVMERQRTAIQRRLSEIEQKIRQQRERTQQAFNQSIDYLNQAMDVMANELTQQYMYSRQQEGVVGIIIAMIGRDKVKRHLKKSILRLLGFISHNMPLRFQDLASFLIENYITVPEAGDIEAGGQRRVINRVLAQIVMYLTGILGPSGATYLIYYNSEFIRNLLENAGKILITSKIDDLVDKQTATLLKDIINGLNFEKISSKPSSSYGIADIQSNKDLLDAYKEIRFGLLPKQCRRVLFVDAKGQIQSYVECEWEKGNFTTYA